MSILNLFVYYLFIKEGVEASAAGEDDKREAERDRHHETQLNDVIRHCGAQAHQNIACIENNVYFYKLRRDYNISIYYFISEENNYFYF